MSLFQQLYKYKQSDQRHQKENFLTEIFAHCLRFDTGFRKKFLDYIGCLIECEDFNCDTQVTDRDFGRPDLVIESGADTIVIIECKVDSIQEETQLNRYANILKKTGRKHLYLIFLTKFYETTNFQDPEINFKHIRWHEIFGLLQDSDNNISLELSKYLIQQKMSNIISFTKSDVNAITFFNEALTKMDEFLVRVKDILTQYTTNKVLSDKRLEDGDYGLLTDFADGKIWVGFFQYENNEEMQICVDLTIPISSKYVNKIEKDLALSDWKTYDNEDSTKTYYSSKDLSFFINTNSVFDTNKAYDFIEIGLQQIKKL